MIAAAHFARRVAVVNTEVQLRRRIIRPADGANAALRVEHRLVLLGRQVVPLL
jgi:hypothetical protein